MKTQKKYTLNLFNISWKLLVCILLSYWIYIHIPYQEYEIQSPYGNAIIKKIVHGRMLFFAYRVSADSHIEILYNGKKIGRVESYCFDCLRHKILDVDWYNDSVRVTYQTNYEGWDTVAVLYKFD